MSENDITYFYDHQLESYVKQFQRIFQNLYVKQDEEYKRLNITYSTKSRIASLINSNRSRWKPASLPIMTTSISSLEFLIEKSVSEMYIDPVIYETEDSHEGFERIVGPAYKLTMDSYILTDSQDEMIQLLEQIMLLFNPKVVIQKSEELTDANYYTEVNLTEIQQDEEIPLGNENIANSYNLTFEFTIRLNYPMKKYPIIQNIRNNLFTQGNEENQNIEDE